MELNEDERARLLADARWKWKMDHAALERQHYRNGLTEGQQQAEAKYQPIIEELKRKLREAGIEEA
jgi:hypothetical protein